MKYLFYSTTVAVLFAIGASAQSTTTEQTTTTTTVPGATMNVTINGMPATTTQQTTVTTTTTTTNTGQQGTYNNQPPPPPSNNGCGYAMNPGDYESAKSTISSKDFEQTKLDVAKQITSSNCLYADQIRDIMKLFGFENSKLEYAKFAYSHCYDKNNYFKVNDAFGFESSSTELSDYINGAH